jgi:uncharacterized membrane protein YczE
MRAEFSPRSALAGRVAQLVASCVVLGIGVGMLLLAALGSDGYSTLINGISLHFDVLFVLVNAVVGVFFVTAAWVRGLRPGVGTIVQPVVVGFTVSAVLGAFDPPAAVWLRVVLLLGAFPVVSAGVAGYLDSALGAGPTEAAVLAWDPPVPFRWSYSVLQGTGALVGWLLGAAIGPGTLAVIFLLGPVVDLIRRRLTALRNRRRARGALRPPSSGASCSG